MKEELKKLMEELKEKMNDISNDFVSNYSLNNRGYICDTMSEFADSETSIYYSEQREFYNSHVELCENALLEFGYNLNDMLKQGDTLEDIICRSATIGEYYLNERQLSEDEESIILYLACDYAINNDIDISRDEIEELASVFNSNDKWSYIVDDLEDFRDAI